MLGCGQNGGMTEHGTHEDATQFWNQRYGEKEQIWSGRVNQQLADVASTLTAGSALDLGAGEGGDAIWLAGQGWQVTAVDISETALSRAAAAATRAGMADRIDFQQHDLATDFPAGSFDLVSAQYLHSPVQFPRTAVLQQAAAAVAGGGRLLIVDHAAPPPWAKAHQHATDGESSAGNDARNNSDAHQLPDLPALSETFQSLELDPAQWLVERCEEVERVATGPDGVTGTLLDNVILARRVG